MTFSRKRLALFAALLVAALAIVGILYASSLTSRPAAAPAATALASPAPSSDSADDGDDASTDAVQAGGTSPSISAVPAGSTSGPVPELKSIHSPDKVARDMTLAAGQCKIRTVDAVKGNFLPDPSCTPGAIDPAVTQENLASTICKSGYTTTVRAAASDTDKVKALSLAQYGQTRAASTEFDHLVSLQLGGTNAVSNLWPEPNRAGAPGTTNPKDAIETHLNKAVCTHKVTLAAAQTAIARDWVTAEKDLGL